MLADMELRNIWFLIVIGDWHARLLILLVGLCADLGRLQATFFLRCTSEWATKITGAIIHIQRLRAANMPKSTLSV